MSKLRCLSVHQPWAWAICAGLKRVENRSWTTKYRGPVCIHAAIAKERLIQFAEEFGEHRVDLLARVTGAIVGVAELVNVVELNEELESDPSAVGPLCWIFERGRLLEQPVPCKGKTSLFYASEAESDEVERNMSNAQALARVVDHDLMLALHGDAVELQINRAVEYWEMERDEDVIRCCNIAIAHSSDQPAAYRCRSAALHQLKRYPEAMADADRAIALEPKFAAAFAARSEVWRAMGNVAAADADLGRAMELDPSIMEAE